MSDKTKKSGEQSPSAGSSELFSSDHIDQLTDLISDDSAADESTPNLDDTGKFYPPQN